MRFILIFLVLQFSSVYAQLNFLDGTWQGVITGFNQQKKDGRRFGLILKLMPQRGNLKVIRALKHLLQPIMSIN
jgi:hypothetical protein